MTEPLFPTVPKLTDRQAAALAYLGREGATALDTGRKLHELNGCPWCRLAGASGCEYAEQSGREVLTALRRKGLVVRRNQTGIWQPTRQATQATTSPTDRIPNEFPEGF